MGCFNSEMYLLQMGHLRGDLCFVRNALLDTTVGKTVASNRGGPFGPNVVQGKQRIIGIWETVVA